ncbi:MAG: response regulator [Magnetococcales bacterium]|nr:response regulator [Magnetococcales bacterium]
MSDEQTKILVVEDEKSNIDLLVGLLSERFRIKVAKNGRQGLERVRANAPDLILLDIMLPEMDGFEVCKRLKADPATQQIPIIFITGLDNPEEETRGLEAGAVDFIRKPFNPNVVLARIDTQLELQRQRRDLEALSELKNRFLGMAAHDMRNPLNAICGLSDLMINMEMKSEERTKFITTINNVGNQMLQLINDLLDVTVIESGSFNMERERDDLGALVQERIDILKVTAGLKEVTIEAEIKQTDTARFDRSRMRQVVDNLLGNAIKFSSEGSSITVRAGTEEGKVYFQVVDRGPGIPKEEQGRLFDAFQKLSTRPTAGEKGAGLGLSIVKKIVDAHEGEVRVNSLPGQGSTFSVYLAVDVDGRVESGVMDSQVEQDRALKLLLIDDDYALRLMYGKAFEEDAFEVVGEAENGKIGIELHQDLKPDITLLDIEMPVMDGVAALQEIMAQSPDSCVIMLTSVDHPKVWEECLLAGAKRYLLKGTPYPVLQRKVLEVWDDHQKVLVS